MTTLKENSVAEITNPLFSQQELQQHNERVDWRNKWLYPAPKPVKEDESKWTKKHIKELLKELTHAAKNNRDQLRELSGNAYDLFSPVILAEQEKLNRRIRDYQWRVRANKRVAGQSNNITSGDVLKAKEQSIENYYTGQLRKTGKDLVGLCPFHNDYHPSFTIYNNGRHYKCFSCSSQGDTISFIQRSQNLSFLETVKLILNLI